MKITCWPTTELEYWIAYKEINKLLCLLAKPIDPEFRNEINNDVQELRSELTKLIEEIQTKFSDDFNKWDKIMSIKSLRYNTVCDCCPHHANNVCGLSNKNINRLSSWDCVAIRDPGTGITSIGRFISNLYNEYGKDTMETWVNAREILINLDKNN